MRVPSPRVQILDKIDELTKSHCEGCQIRENVRVKEGADRAVRNCLNNCDIGKHLNKLGNMLLETKAKDSSKYKNKSVNGVEKLVNLTKEIYQDLKAQGKSDKWIMQEYLYGNGQFYKLKNTWGLVVGKGRQPDEPIKKKISADVIFKGLTKEKLQDLIAQGVSNKEIQKMHDLNNIVFYKMKNDWGMVRKIKMRDEVPVDATPVEEKLIQKDSVIKSLLLQKDELIKKMHNLRSEDVEVIDKLKLENKSLLHEVATLKTDTLLMSQLKAKNAALTGIVDRDVPIINDLEETLELSKGIINGLEIKLVRNEEALDLARNKIKGLEVDNNNLKEDFKINIEKLNSAQNDRVGLKEEIMILKDALKIAEKERLDHINCFNDKDKIFRLKSLLAHSENNNNDLIRQIKSLSKFRNMYFKTAEVLKIHLPN